MKLEIKNIFIIAFIFIGTILGAGFASGKELIVFFGRFNNLGILGFFISCVIFFIICWSLLFLIHKLNVEKYEDFLYHLFGRSLGRIVLLGNYLFLFSMFFIMIAGGGASLKAFFNTDNTLVFNTIFTFLIFFCLIFGQKGLIRVNSIIAPILVLGIICVGIYIQMSTKQTIAISTEIAHSSIIYSAYNIISTISLLFSLKNLILNKRICFFAALFSNIIIFFIGFLIMIPLVKSYNFVFNLDLPIYYIIEYSVFRNIYNVILFLAIFTTALGNGFSISEFITKNFNLNQCFIKLIICTLGLVFSLFGFSTLIEKIYPFFGYFGVFQLIVIFLNFIKLKQAKF